MAYCARCGRFLTETSGCAYCGFDPDGPIAVEAPDEVPGPRSETAPVTGGGQASMHDATAVRYAGFWLRFVAYSLDAFLLFCLAYAIFGILYVLGSSILLAPLGYFVAAYIYVWVGDSFGGTVGKWAIGLRVVSVDDGRTPIGLGWGFARTLGRIISAWPLGLGWFWCGWDARKQTWHDKWARSLVIRK